MEDSEKSLLKSIEGLDQDNTKDYQTTENDEDENF